MVITSVPGSAGNVQTTSLSSSDASGQTSQTTHVASPGTGGMQGTVVSVGDGSERAQILDDSAQAEASLFAKFSNAVGTFFWNVHEALEELNGLRDSPYDNGEGEDDVAPEVDKRPMPVVENDEHEERIDGSGLEEHEDALSDIDDTDDSGYLSFDDESEFSDVEYTSLQRQEIDHDRRLDDAVQDNDEIVMMSLEELLGDDFDKLPPLIVGDREARDASEAEVQQPQRTWMGGLRNMAGWMAGGLVGMLPTALVGQAATQASAQAGAVQSPTETFSDQNLAKANELVKKIDTKMKLLNLQLRALGVEGANSTTGANAPREQMDQPELSTGDTLKRWYYRARGGASAAVTTLGWATVGAGTTAVGANLPGLSPEMLTIRATALLGGAYMGLSALRDFPELATNHAAIAMLNDEMPAILTDMVELDDIMGQERARQTGMVRALLVSEARSPRIDAMKVELTDVTEALRKVEAGEVQAVPELRHEVALGDGKASAEVKSLATQAREAFASFFEPIGRGLASAGRFIADLPNVASRWLDARAAGKAEQAYAKDAQMMFTVLATPTSKSDIRGGVDVRASERANANGIKHDISHVRKQCHMGENLTRTLLKQDGQAFGAVAYKTEHDSVSVKASLTTARAMAWYLDAIAAPEHIDDPDAPKVTRNEDGSLTVKDPDRKLYSFLMNVPVAHEGVTLGDGQQSLAFQIDDHHQGMPQGMHGMRFETRMSDNGEEELHLSFTPKSADPVFKPLRNEAQQIKSIYEAAHSSPQREIAQGKDFSTWPADRLVAHQEKLLFQLDREQAMHNADQQQIEALKNWHNPDFISGRA